MKEVDDLIVKHPILFKEYPRCGIDLPKGWVPIVQRLCAAVESHLKCIPEENRAGWQVAQIKEKFGGLRFYMTGEDDFITGAITVAEGMSYHICETCGLPGEIRKSGWWRTLCDAHAAEREKT